MFSDTIFDREDDIPAWVPNTQDTDYSIQPSQTKSHQEQLEELENEDPIWPIDDKFPPNNMWTPYGFASMGDDTGSTFSTTEDALPTTQSFREALHRAAKEYDIPITEPTQELDDGNVAMDVEDDGADSELEDILRSGKATISLVPVCFIFSETLLIVC